MQGNLVLAVDMPNKRGNPTPPLRGEIKGYSASSRKRQLQTVSRAGNAVPVFVTMTYGEKFPDDPSDWKRHLDKFFKRLKRKHPDYSALWRLEPQERGAPHFHLLVYQSSGKRPFLPWQWVANSWAEASEDVSPEHIAAGTRVEALRSARGAAFYVAKYLAKLPEGEERPEWAKVGRHWGIHNRGAFPFAKQHEMLLHSDLEQRAVMYAMRDAYKGALIDSHKRKILRQQPDIDDMIAQGQAEKWFDEQKELNQYLDCSGTFYGTAEEFLSRLAGVRFNLEFQIACHCKKEEAFVRSLVDRNLAAV